MKEKRIQLISTGILVVIMLLLAAVGFARPRESRQVTVRNELNGKTLAGIKAARMPEESAQVFFETLFSVELASYRSVSTFPELLYELRSGRADAIWCPDFTAEYLLKLPEGKGLKCLELETDTANGTADGGRLSFAMAVAEGNTELQTRLNAALNEAIGDGTVKALLAACMEPDQTISMSKKQKKTGKTYALGVTGTLPPIDMFDASGKPCGFSVYLVNELESRTGDRYKLVPVTPETSFTALKSGKVDALFAFGTSKNTTPGEKDYLMTVGYCTMMEYACLVPFEEK